MTVRGRLIGFFGIAAAAIALDQATKAWARTALVAGPAPLVPGVMRLQLVRNTGAAFSVGSGSTWLFALLAFGVCALCVVWVMRSPAMPTPLACALGAVVGGGAGNLIDRVAYGGVTDFFATTFINFPVFNVADIFVTLGVAVTLVLWWRYDGARGQSKD